MKFSLFLPALFLLAASCSMQPTPASLSGSWTQPVPGQPGHVQGMQLLPDGRAVSINMHTLLYQGWQLDGSRLILTGKIIKTPWNIVIVIFLAIDLNL